MKNPHDFRFIVFFLLSHSPFAISVLFPRHFLSICPLCLFLVSPWQAHAKLHLVNFFLIVIFTTSSTLSSSALLLSALITPKIVRTRLVSQTRAFSCFFVSAVVSSPFMYAEVTHQLSTFPLRQLRLFPITSSTSSKRKICHCPSI